VMKENESYRRRKRCTISGARTKLSGCARNCR